MQVVSGKFWLVQKHQANVTFAIYSCSNSNDRYVDSDAMRRLGEVKITVEDPAKVTNPDTYTFTVSFTFGGTELQATAVDDQTQKQAQTSVVFVAE